MGAALQSDLVGRRRRLNPDQRRRELLDAAVRVLRERGPTECRVEDITAEAGTAKGNFYRYFPTWDALLVAVRDHMMDEYTDDVRRRLTTGHIRDPWTILEEEVDRFLEFQLGLGGLHDAVFHGPVGWAGQVDAERSAASLVAALLTAGVDDGSFAGIDIGPTAALLSSVLHGAADEIRAGTDHAEMRAAALFIFRRTLAPLAPPG